MKRKKLLFFAIFVAIGLLVFVYIQRTNVKEIKFNQTYSIKKKDGSNSYIKFIDKENYIAVSSFLSAKKSFEEGTPYIVFYTKGKYSIKNNQYQLGNNINRITLTFNKKKDFDVKKYNQIYFSKYSLGDDFGEGTIKKVDKSWVYRKKEKKSDNYSLKVSNKTVPSSADDFLQNFSVKKNNVSEIKYGETYTFLQDEKSYIKFLDEENYVAMPGMRSIKKVWGMEAPTISFILKESILLMKINTI